MFFFCLNILLVVPGFILTTHTRRGISYMLIQYQKNIITLKDCNQKKKSPSRASSFSHKFKQPTRLELSSPQKKYFVEKSKYKALLKIQVGMIIS